MTFLFSTPFSLFAQNFASVLHLWIFEIPAIQNIRTEQEINGKTYVHIKGADISTKFPERGVVLSSKVLAAETQPMANFLRNKLPEPIVNEAVAVNCLLEEKDIHINLKKSRIFSKQTEFGQDKSLWIRLELKKVLEPDQLLLQISLKVKNGKVTRKIINSEYLWNTMEQIYVGVASGFGKGREACWKSTKGDVYFIVLLNEGNKD
ncbi:MAG: hypothetical protein QME69_10620 [Candidatus Saccharicenans sp.]|nr:hypothetical protein [Candidatus Saccharicenans sp.]